MKECTLKIELLSDLCVSDGGAYNSMVDIDICYDRFGFPFIPAKRIRGCLRECAIELNDWGDTINEKVLFGDKGAFSNGARLRIGNAYIENHVEKRHILEKDSGNIISHPQNVLSIYSYLRSQTSINYDTGVADDGSLRTMRVANKGLIFYADVSVDEGLYEDLNKCCMILRHMGIGRTRGFGEVKATLCEAEKDERISNAPLVDGADRLRYEIELFEPVIMKSVNGGESNTQDYIEGAKMLGLISRHLNEDFLEFMSKGKLICSNAYISKNGNRYTETPGYIFKIKNDKSKYINKLYETEERRAETVELQLNQTKHSYAYFEDGGIDIADVLTQERYHHRRPDDKSIGRAKSNADGDADFYQMDSIAEGQVFAGEIAGSPEQIKEVYRILTNNNPFYIGYSKSSEYGHVQIKVTDTTRMQDIKKSMTNEVVIISAAPAVIYNEKAMTSTVPDDLVEEVLAAIGINQRPSSAKSYLRYITIGGFNVTWNKRKPTLDVFDKGTAIHLTFDEEVEVPNNEMIFIGERTSEGYGETFVMPIDSADNKYYVKRNKAKEVSGSADVEISTEFETVLCKSLLHSFIRKKALDAVKVRESYRPTISNMILMTKNAFGINDVKKAVDERYSKVSEVKEEKKKVAYSILEKTEEVEKIINEFEEKYKIRKLNINIDEVKMMFLKEYLTQAKYVLRQGGEEDE